MSGIREIKCERGVYVEIRAAAPFAERGRQHTCVKIGASQKKRHCQSGKYAFERAKLAKLFGPLNLSEILTGINKARKQN